MNDKLTRALELLNNRSDAEWDQHFNDLQKQENDEQLRLDQFYSAKFSIKYKTLCDYLNEHDHISDTLLYYKSSTLAEVLAGDDLWDIYNCIHRFLNVPRSVDHESMFHTTVLLYENLKFSEISGQGTVLHVSKNS